MIKHFEAKNLDELESISQEIITALGNSRVVLLNGGMGAGKTTLVKAMLTSLGADDNGSSPTFSLINQYSSVNHGTIFHLDLYRLNSMEEALDIGIEDVLYDGNWCFIEWPENIISLLPENYGQIDIQVDENGLRQIRLNVK
jgi:tRNA threonylcarbamoyladenosine biosynthesis protein TsaE